MKWLAAIALLSSSVPAPAMNWEGHDDWMEDHPAAVALEREIDGARPLPPVPCGARLFAAGNPYEQVPLPGSPCTAPLVPRR